MKCVEDIDMLTAFSLWQRLRHFGLKTPQIIYESNEFNRKEQIKLLHDI